MTEAVERGVKDVMARVLTIRNVPDALARRLQERARRNHRSLQDELMAILEEAVEPQTPLTASQILARVRQLGFKTPAESADIIRADRERR